MIAANVQRIALAAGLTIASFGAAHACAQYDAVVAAVQGDDAPRAAELFEEISVSAACDDALREWVGDYLARESFLFAVNGAETPQLRREALEQALAYEKHWRSYAELGRLDWELQNYAPAATSFQLALNELVDGDPSHEATDEEIAEIYELASAAVALADTPVSMPSTRSGEAGGIFKTKIRGFTVEEVPLPITFAFDSTDFDDTGLSYANALADHVMMLSPSSVRLAGHTDPVGDAGYNMGLSEARAMALAEFLRAAGFDGEIEIAAYGETQVPEPPIGIEADSEEHHRIARRVAFSAE
ncbi:MAG: OmpA family protein [Pseudomonadota bacterium]